MTVYSLIGAFIGGFIIGPRLFAHDNTIYSLDVLNGILFGGMSGAIIGKLISLI